MSGRKHRHRTALYRHTRQTDTINNMSGITDEAAVKTHDLIHDAEVEEERVRRQVLHYTN